jgi:hypothetical protein
MKQISPIFKLLFALILFTFSSVKAQESSTIHLVSSTNHSLQLKFESSPYEFVEVETPEGVMNLPQMEGASPLLIKGAPDLQKYACSYIIPDGENPSIQVLSATYKDYKVEVAPSKGNLLRNVNPAEMPYSFGSQYAVDAFFPTTIFESQESHAVRDFEAQALWVYPFQYNPITKILRVYDTIELDIQFNSTIKYPRSMDSQFKMIYENLFINYGNTSRTSLEDEDGSMLIIAYNEFIDPMQNFMDWKTQKGIVNEIVDVATIGGQDEIKTYIEDYYNSHNLTYVLLVGDHQHIPSYSASSGYSDNYYGYIEGDDSYPEVFVGRFSAEDKSQVTTQVNRVLQYEQTPATTDHYARGLGVGSDQGPGDDGEYDYQHLRNIREGLLDYTYTTGYELYDGSQGGEDASGNPSASDMHALLEDGLGIINYTGHGSTFSCGTSGYNSTNVDQLTNTSVHPFFWSVACVNGNFTDATCFAETWLRATHNGQPTGAIATLMSTINQSWSPPMEGQDHMNFILSETSENSDSRSFGGISMNGCMQMNDTYGSGGADMTDTWTCFGDPSVIVRTQAPETMAVSYNPAIPVGSTSLDVSCSTDGALVSLTLDGEIIGTAVVFGGMTTVNFDALSSIGDITVTVTAFNSVPNIGTSSIIVLDGPWLVVTAYEVGDEDGLASYYENFPLYFTIENIGTEATTTTYLNTETNGAIAIGAFGDNIPGLEPGESLTYTDESFWANVSWDAVDGEEAQVTFSMNSDEGTWYSTINIPVHAPVLEVSSVDADLSFGETTVAIITLTNNGSADFNGGIASLVSAGTYVTVLNDITIEALASGESINLEYEVSLVADAPSSTSLDLSLVVTEGWFEQSTAVELETPMCQSSDLDIELTIMTDTWGSETSWNFTNADGVILASVEAGSYGNSSTYTAAVCAAEGTLMTFNIQDTYGDGIYAPNGYWVTVCGNEVAQGDAFGSGASETFVVTCDVFIEVPGCMDPEADNYNSEANLDDGTCVYTIDCESATALQLNMVDSYGDGWNGNYFEMYDLGGNQLVNTTLESGSSGTYDFCLNDGCYSIVTTGAGSWTYEVSWILVSGVDTLATGLSPSSTWIALNQDCGFVNGCTDASACNYNADANVEDYSCLYAAAYYDCEGSCLSDVDGDGFCDELEIYGCTDENAVNYNSEASEEDNSCVYAEDCESNFVVLTLNDSFGDGWNGNVLNVMNSNSDIVITVTLDAGSQGQESYCLENDCYVFNTTDDGGWPYEVSWDLISANGETILSGTAPSVSGLSLGVEACDFSGCTDELASNYEPNAIEDDGSCEYEECICPDVWDPVCGVDGITYGNSCEADCVGVEYVEGECSQVVIGCTDETAINYNPDATEDDGTCEYDSTGCAEGQIEDCNGNCAPSNWVGDGVCDDGNYTSGGNSIYFTCEEFDFDGGDCSDVTLVYGCTDATALNYNSEANTDDGSCEYEQTVGPWEVLITGSNHTIAVGGDTPITIDDMPIENGDWIGVFYTDDNGDLQCAGYSEWNSETTAIAAQGDDSTTDEIDGLQTGEIFVWMIWDASEDVIYTVNASYLAGMPSGAEFVINGITGLESLHTAPEVSEQIIELPLGWSLFSTYMLTDNMDVVEMLTAINSEIIIVKDNAGLAYLPEWGFNGIGDMIVGQGYQIKLTSASTLIVEGLYMEPEDNPITLTEGWNMFGCLRLQGSDVTSVFADIVDDVVIVKNGEGLAYLPEWGFNGIGNIEPGQGYQAKMNATQILNYLPNDQEYRLAVVSMVNNSSLSHFSTVRSTGNNMQLLIEDAAWDVKPKLGDELAVRTNEGLLIGSALYTSPTTVLTIWGDDETTEVKDGAIINNSYSLALWKSDDNIEVSVDLSSWILGDDNYQPNEIVQVASLSIDNSSSVTELFTAKPNPATQQTTLSYYLSEDSDVELSLFNVLGERVMLLESTFKLIGSHEHQVELSDLDPGAYFYQLSVEDRTYVKRLNILK